MIYLQTMIKRSRTLLLFLAFILILAPLSTLAEAGNKKDINYVALGDSLTANQLHDGSFGEGFVPLINAALTDSGYDVHETNEGVPGYTSAHVLADLENTPELANADLITISAGANDVLSELDPLMGLDPTMLVYLLPGKVDELVGEAEEAVNVARETIEASSGEVETAYEAIVLLKETAEEIKDALLPDTEFAFDELIDKMDEVEKYIQDAAGYLDIDYENMSADDVKDASESLRKASEELTSVLEMIEGMEEDILNDLSGFVEEINGAILLINEATDEVENAEAVVAHADELIELAEEAREFLKENGPKIDAIWENLREVGGNLSLILAEINEINPEADIYVMGYYNALPYVPMDMQEVTVPLLETLNMAIESPTNLYGATFIPTFEAFEGNYEAYLPNPKDIHPSEAGYEAIAKAFMQEISNQYPKFTEPVEPVTRELVIGETIEVGPGDKVLIRDTMTTLQLPSDLPAGTTVTITETDDKIKEKAEGLHAFGDTLHFAFAFPEGYEAYEGNFELTMGYEEDAPDDVNIYYYNEDKEQWENKAGNVNKEATHITLQVTHFSNYGVFAEEKVTAEPTQPQKPVDQEGPTETEKIPSTSGGEGNELPKTATNMFNWMVVGAVFIIAGISTILIIRKKERHAQ